MDSNKNIIRLVNRNESSIRLVVEPWGTEFQMLPGDVFEVQVTEKEGNTPEIEFKDGLIILWSREAIIRHENIELFPGLN